MVLIVPLAAAAQACSNRKPRLTKAGAFCVEYSFCPLRESRYMRVGSGGGESDPGAHHNLGRLHGPIILT